MNDKCPKCQAETSYRRGAYKCGSLEIEGRFVQSDLCRIAELEAKNARLKADKEWLEEQLCRDFDVCERMLRDAARKEQA